MVAVFRPYFSPSLSGKGRHVFCSLRFVSGKKKSKSSGSRRGNVGRFKSRPQDSYPAEDDSFEHGHPAPRDASVSRLLVVLRLSLDLRGVVVVVSSRHRQPFRGGGKSLRGCWLPPSAWVSGRRSAPGFLPAWEEITYDAFVLSVVREGFFLFRYCGTSS